METEKRAYPRYSPEGLRAGIAVEKPGHDLICMTGEIIDISCTGIKIKLDSPITANLIGKVRIEFELPKSGVPVKISGAIKHWESSSVFGLYFAEENPYDFMDSLLFECIKLIKSS